MRRLLGLVCVFALTSIVSGEEPVKVAKTQEEPLQNKPAMKVAAPILGKGQAPGKPGVPPPPGVPVQGRRIRLKNLALLNDDGQNVAKGVVQVRIQGAEEGTTPSTARTYRIFVAIRDEKTRKLVGKLTSEDFKSPGGVLGAFNYSAETKIPPGEYHLQVFACDPSMKHDGFLDFGDLNKVLPGRVKSMISCYSLVK